MKWLPRKDLLRVILPLALRARSQGKKACLARRFWHEDSRRFGTKILGRQLRQAWHGDLLAYYRLVIVRESQDARHFIELGLDESRLIIGGNIKFDIHIDEQVVAAGKALRQSCGERPVWIAASTHEGEEALILAAHQQIQKTYPKALLILVPRHPERFDQVATLIKRYDFKVERRSVKASIAPTTDVYLGDTLGELLLMYASADVAFLGGSLVPIGGHNFLEPAALKVALLSGPHVHNFSDISAHLRARHALKIVEDADSLAVAVKQLFNNDDLRVAMGQSAKEIVVENRGAVKKHVDSIIEFVD